MEQKVSDINARVDLVVFHVLDYRLEPIQGSTKFNKQKGILRCNHRLSDCPQAKLNLCDPLTQQSKRSEPMQHLVKTYLSLGFEDSSVKIPVIGERSIVGAQSLDRLIN
jgi:hypothetical protein